MSRALRPWVSVALATASVMCASLAQAQPYSNPIGCENCISYWYYLDHGGTDWNCGRATYSGHNGTDYSLRGGNGAIGQGNEVVAAAAGVVTIAVDGNFDQCTACGGSGCGTNTPGGGFSNYVVIDHGGQNTTYGHMRKGSIKVRVGDRVTCGQVLGHIGSAGCSTGAHLHFQPRPTGGSYTNNPLDPYQGNCSPTPASLWATQGPYRGLPGKTCDAAPPTPQCPVDTFPVWTCTADGGSRRRCVDGIDSKEACPWRCTEAAAGTDDTCALPPDADGDGARADTDCDDTRSNVHPGALELCGDAIDQDCSGGDLPCSPTGAGGGPATGGAGGLSGTGGTFATGGVVTAGVPGGPGGAPPLGSGGSPWSGGGGAGGAGNPGVTPPPAGVDEPDGCTCRMHRPASSAGYLPVATLLGALALRRRVRRSGNGRRSSNPHPSR